MAPLQCIHLACTDCLAFGMINMNYVLSVDQRFLSFESIIILYGLLIYSELHVLKGVTHCHNNYWKTHWTTPCADFGNMTPIAFIIVRGPNIMYINYSDVSNYQLNLQTEKINFSIGYLHNYGRFIINNKKLQCFMLNAYIIWLSIVFFKLLSTLILNEYLFWFQ